MIIFTLGHGDHFFSMAGWVRNLPDGSVESLLCGEKEMVSTMLAWLKQGSPYSRVDTIVDEIDIDKKFSTFEIRY